MPLPHVPGLQILHDDGLCLVVDKPGGVLTQAPPDIDSLEWRLKRWFRQQNPSAAKIYCGVPHRLDRPASGAMVFSRNLEGTRHLAQQFQLRSVEKVYWALVDGEVAPRTGTWSDFMRKIPEQARSEVVEAEHPEAQLALLKYEVLAVDGGQSWLKIKLETGRTHQIRLQTASRGFPLLGDELYGSTTRFGPETLDLRARWIALHARRIGFDHPTLGKRLRIEAPLFEPWLPWVQRFGPHSPDIAAAQSPFLAVD